jgi:hypothetical protein
MPIDSFAFPAPYANLSRMIQKSVASSSLISLAKIACVALAASLLAGCAGMGGGGGNYHTTAYAPTPGGGPVKVKVSLKTQNVYVEQGDQLLMGTPTCVGKPGYLTPTGSFAVTGKDRDKRSSTYGYWTNGTEAHPGTSSQSRGPGWHYVGYPMAYWVEFAPGYGFHEGPIWPYPRSHGCLHLHESAVVKFSELVHEGTPVIIAESLPEDEKWGRSIERPTDYADPDPAPMLMISSSWFTKPRPSELLPPKGTASTTATASATPPGSDGSM